MEFKKVEGVKYGDHGGHGVRAPRTIDLPEKWAFRDAITGYQ